MSECIPVPYFRSSSFNGWDYCQQQYYLNYVLGLPQDVNAKAQKGTMFHKVMECLALGKLALQNKGIAEDDVCGIIDTERLYDINYVYELLDIAFEHYRKHDPDSFLPKDKKDIKKWIDETLVFNNGMFDPRKRTIFAAEQNFDFDIPEPWAKLEDGRHIKLKGTIDLITQIDDTTIEIIDWKSGQRKDWATGEEKDHAKLQKDAQLMIYFYALKHLYPEKTILFTIYFVRDGGPFTLHFDDEVIQKVSGMLKERYLEITNTKVPKIIGRNTMDFKWKCCKLCSYYKHTYEDTGIPICDFIHRQIKNNGIEYVTLNFKNQKFDSSSYKAPGE